MTSHTKRYLDAAVDELKRNGYMVLVVLLDTKHEPSLAKASPVTVISSETDDPVILAGMLSETLETVIHPTAPELTN